LPLVLSEPEVQEAYRLGQAACPSVCLSWASFLTSARDCQIDSRSLLASAEDFYLAYAAGAGNCEAIRIIDERFVPQLSRRIKRLGTPVDILPDILQAVRERLFTGPTPRIRAYNGSVPLEQWLRVVAVRLTIDLHRREAALPRAEVGLAELLTSRSPDAAEFVMKSEYKRELESALRSELLTLSSRDRTVLRLHAVEGVSVEKIAIMYGVHRVTVARWVWMAGESILEGLRRRFRDQFGLTSLDFDSLAQLVRSQLSLGLEEALSGPPGPMPRQSKQIRQ
jgi:RNA polymerase sigma-70 factor (ECF subfamily)